MKAKSKAKASTELHVGQAVLIRTATYHYTGRIAALSAEFITLLEAAWIADTGRYHHAFAVGFDRNAEIEPYPVALPVHIALGAIVEVAEWPHLLPTTVQ